MMENYFGPPTEPDLEVITPEWILQGNCSDQTTYDLLCALKKARSKIENVASFLPVMLLVGFLIGLVVGALL